MPPSSWPNRFGSHLLALFHWGLFPTREITEHSQTIAPTIKVSYFPEDVGFFHFDKTQAMNLHWLFVMPFLHMSPKKDRCFSNQIESVWYGIIEPECSGFGNLNLSRMWMKCYYLLEFTCTAPFNPHNNSRIGLFHHVEETGSQKRIHSFKMAGAAFQSLWYKPILALFCVFNKKDKVFLLVELRIATQKDSYYCFHVPMCYDPCWFSSNWSLPWFLIPCSWKPVVVRFLY
jgi:hypothetical protein